MTDQSEAVQWVALHILKHEAALRQWLRRVGVRESEIDDLVQQTYCKLSELKSVHHIHNPRSYFFTTARSLLLQHIRRDRVVQILAASDQIDEFEADQSPSPERAVGARVELRKVMDAIAALPQRYREVIELRRIEGLSQRETANRLGVTEKIVENGLARGLKAVLRAVEIGGLREEVEITEERVRNVSQR